MEEIEMDIDMLTRLQREGVRMAESAGSGSVTTTDRPLKGVVGRQNSRNTSARDILNIGSGTRCTNCGLLYFCWTESCNACGRAMEFNLGHRNEEARA